LDRVTKDQVTRKEMQMKYHALSDGPSLSAFSRRRMFGALLTPFIGGCSPGRFFHFGWKEEVLVAPQSIAVVTLQYTYENLGGLFDGRYEHAILRQTDLSFDARAPIGTFSKSFDHHHVDLLISVGSAWYFVLEARGDPPAQLLPDGRYEPIWGRPENAAGQKCWRIDQNGLTRASLNDLPKEIAKPNVLMDYAPVKELAALDGSSLTLAMKTAFDSRFPVYPPAGRIERPAIQR